MEVLTVQSAVNVIRVSNVPNGNITIISDSLAIIMALVIMVWVAGHNDITETAELMNWPIAI